MGPECEPGLFRKLFRRVGKHFGMIFNLYPFKQEWQGVGADVVNGISRLHPVGRLGIGPFGM